MSRLKKIMDFLSYGFLLATILVVPFFLDKNLVNFFVISKQYVFSGLVLLTLLIFVLKIIFTKKIKYNYSIIDIPVISLLVIFLFSSIFSINRYSSFLGKTEYFVFNSIFFVSLILFYFLITNIVKDKKRWSILVNTIIYSGGLVSFFTVIALIFKVNIFSYIGIDTVNIIDPKVSIFATWNLMIFLLSLGKLLKKEKNIFTKVLFILIALFSFIIILTLNIKMIWLFMLLGLTLLIISGVLFTKNIKVGNMSVLFLFLVLNVVFLVFSTPSFLNANIPVEISLGYKSTWDITYNSIFSGIKNFIFGSGPGTFNVIFSKFRNVGFNYDSVAWSLRFGEANNTIFAILSELGVLFTIVFFYTIIYIFGYILNVSYSQIKESKSTVKELLDNFTNDIQDFIDLLIISVVWFALTFIMFFITISTVLWWMWWMLLGLIVVGLSFSNDKIIKTKEWTIENTPEKSLVFSFISIVILVFVVLMTVFGIKLYRAEIFYAEAINSTTFEDTVINLSKAINYRNTENKYYVALAQTYLNKAVELSTEEDASVQDVSVYVAEAVNNARIATNLSPNSVELWENLAAMYRNASLFISEANDWEKEAYEKSQELEPSNPVFSLNIANYYLGKENYEEAEKNYEKAIELKNDYFIAYIGLASIYESQSDLDKALITYERIISYASEEYEFLYNYARVLYNRNNENDRENAEKIWNYVIQLNPKYSNAYYSLGLLYESKNNKTKALEYFNKLKELLPENETVLEKINSLTSYTSPVEETVEETVEVDS